MNTLRNPTTVVDTNYKKSIAAHWSEENVPMNSRLGDMESIYHHHYGIGDANTSVLTDVSTSFIQNKQGFVIPELHCPAPIFVNNELDEEIDNLLIGWLAKMGIYSGQCDKIRNYHIGHYTTLCHPFTNDLDRLLLAAQLASVVLSVDDYYGDEADNGANFALASPRLALVLAALEPIHIAKPYESDLELALNNDPVLAGVRSYIEHAEHVATPGQIARIRSETVGMLLTMTAEAAWRMTHTTPAIWEYLAHRKAKGFLMNIAMVDLMEGYELPANIYSAPDVRRVTLLAADASILANDLYSLKKEIANKDMGEFNLPLLLAAEHHCSIQDAVNLSASIHDSIAREYDAADRALLLNGAPPLLRRYLAGLRAWIGGIYEWQRTTGRYN